MFEFLSDMGPGMKGFLGGAAAIGIPLLFNLWKEVHFDARKREEERAYISVQLVFLLDKFVARCADVAWDEGYDPTSPEPDDSELEAQTIIPTFDMSGVKGEHKYLQPEMLARLHSIEIKLQQVKDTLNIDGDWNYPGNGWQYFEARRELYGEVGIYAASIAEDLRKKFKITAANSWEPAERIRRSMQQLEDKKAAREERHRQRKAERERKAASAQVTDTE